MTDAAARPAPEHLIVGQITKPHGTRGEVFIWPLTDTPDNVFAEGRELLLGDENGVIDGAEAPLIVERSRAFKRGVLVKLEGLEDRAAVELLAQRYVLAPTSALAPPGEDEVYYHELLGLEVSTVDGVVVGRVREVFETEPSHLLEVKGADGAVHLIPFARRIVKQLDVAGGRLVIDPPPGLLEL